MHETETKFQLSHKNCVLPMNSFILMFEQISPSPIMFLQIKWIHQQLCSQPNIMVYVLLLPQKKIGDKRINGFFMKLDSPTSKHDSYHQQTTTFVGNTNPGNAIQSKHFQIKQTGRSQILFAFLSVMHIIRIVFLVSFCQVKNETRIKTFRLQEFRLEKTRIPIGDKKSSLVSGSIFVFRLAFLFGCIPHYIFSSEWNAENLSHWHFSSAKNGEYKARKNRNSHKLRHICIYPIFYKYGKNSIQAISTTQPTTITDTRKK